METALFWLVKLVQLAGPTAVLVVAQQHLKPKSEAAAKWVSLGAALALVMPAWQVVSTLVGGLPLAAQLGALVRAVWPAVLAVGIVSIAWGLVQLIDEANPPKVTLPPALATVRGEGANRFALGFWLACGALAVLVTANRYGEWEAGGEELFSLGLPYALTRLLSVGGFLVALLVLQYAGWRLQQHEGLAKWLLTRRPHDVWWTYPHQLTVRRNGVVTGVHWSAMVSSASGYRVGLPCVGQDHAHALVVAITQHCPGIIVGFSPEAAAAYTARRAALEAAAPPTTLR